MLVIPAIDLLDGKVVRLQQGSYEKVTVYNENLRDEAQKFHQAGFRHIHIVDLDGARDGSSQNFNLIKQIKDESGLTIQTGGGLRSYADAKKFLDAGIDQIVCSSMAVKSRSDWMKLLQNFPDKMILGLDLKEGEMAYGGWLKTTGQSINSFLKPMIEQGLRYVLCTDIARDGMLKGPNFELYQSLKELYPMLKFIASGGVSSNKDLEKLTNMGLYGVVVGRAYYEGIISLDEMQEFNLNNQSYN